MTKKNINNNIIINKWLKKKGWNLFKHQKDVITNLSLGKNVLLNAPTGSGKTLGGFLPVFNDLLSNKNKNLHTIYISPLKALAYDIERNLLKPINEMNLNISISSRTGDTSFTKKKSQLINPPNIIITTIESFALLMSEKNTKFYFRNLKFLIVDEVHSIINSKRGELLSLNISRLNMIVKKLQTILLSATISNPLKACKYFCNKKCKIVKADIKKIPCIQIIGSSKNLPMSGHIPDYANMEIYKKIQNKTSIIFVNTRAQAELLFQNLWKINSQNIKIALNHGSLEKNLRTQVEKKMAEKKIDCVVATSSLDLGLDWSNVNLIVQIGSPKGISRLIQRIGRSNHFIDGKSSAILVPTNCFDYIECCAAIQSIENDDKEIQTDKLGSLDVLAQHIIGISCHSHINLEKLYKNIVKSWPYRELKKSKFLKIISFLKNGGYSLKNYEQFSRLKKTKNGDLTIKSEKFIKKYKYNVGTIVESEMLEVKLNNKTLGRIEDWFIQKLRHGDTFIFGGKILKLESIDLNVVKVKKTVSKRPKIPSYAGGRIPLSSKLSERVIKLLNNENLWIRFPKQIIKWLNLQKNLSSIPPENGLLVESFKRMNENLYVFYTFQGKNANQTLGFAISKKLESEKINSLGFVSNDYALALSVDKEINDIKEIIKYNNLKGNLFEWLEESSLLKRNFKKVATISCLLDKGYPNQKNKIKQLPINSDLIFKVLNKYEKNHILLEATLEESKRDLIDLDRVNNYLSSIENKIYFNKLKRPSPLSIPMILEINREYLDKNKSDEFYLQNLEKDLLKEVGLE